MMIELLLAGLMLGAQATSTATPAQGRGGGQGRGAGAAQGRGAAQQEPAPPAPAPGTPGTFKSNAELMDVLQKNLASSQGGMTTSAVSNTDQYRINIVHRDRAAGAIAHAGNTELHYIIEGSGTVVTGGTIERPAGAQAGNATIKNGVERRITKGDIIIIPPDTPHWYKAVDGKITYLEVRFVAPK
jgi:mannose-6-phosphate isomerase-like protein (cupin superfamily)